MLPTIVWAVHEEEAIDHSNHLCGVRLARARWSVNRQAELSARSIAFSTIVSCPKYCKKRAFE